MEGHGLGGGTEAPGEGRLYNSLALWSTRLSSIAHGDLGKKCILRDESLHARAAGAVNVQVWRRSGALRDRGTLFAPVDGAGSALPAARWPGDCGVPAVYGAKLAGADALRLILADAQALLREVLGLTAQRLSALSGKAQQVLCVGSMVDAVCSTAVAAGVMSEGQPVEVVCER